MPHDPGSDPDLDRAYALETPDDSRRLYAEWAETYEEGFAREMGYRLHLAVAEAFRRCGACSPVLDLGAGTGLVGAALSAQGVRDIDGTDISPEMLAVAGRKAAYRRLFEGDLTQRLAVADATYASAVSAGTFTNGHVGPEALAEVLRVVQPGGWIILSVNEVHWAAKGFATALANLGSMLADTRLDKVDIYEGSEGPHAHDQACMLCLKRA